MSPRSLERSIALRDALLTAATCAASALTCASPFTVFKSYSLSVDVAAAMRAVPSATPPRAVARSANKSAASSACAAISSNSSCSCWNCGPFTFQCACLARVLRSTVSARRAFNKSINSRRVSSAICTLVGKKLGMSRGSHGNPPRLLDLSPFGKDAKKPFPQLGALGRSDSLFDQPAQSIRIGSWRLTSKSRAHHCQRRRCFTQPR